MRQNKLTMLGIAFVVLLILAVTLISGRRLSRKLEEGESRRVEVVRAISDEEKRTEEIRSLQEEMQSSSYKEQVARERLGIVKDGEIVFKEEE